MTRAGLMGAGVEKWKENDCHSFVLNEYVSSVKLPCYL